MENLHEKFIDIKTYIVSILALVKSKAHSNSASVRSETLLDSSINARLEY